MKYRIRTAEEYLEWYESLRAKEKVQVEKRLDMIRREGHFGHDKDLKQGLGELKFSDGRRIYYTIVFDDNGNIVVLLLGGNKNGQSKDITKARKILRSFN